MRPYTTALKNKTEAELQEILQKTNWAELQAQVDALSQEWRNSLLVLNNVKRTATDVKQITDAQVAEHQASIRLQSLENSPEYRTCEAAEWWLGAVNHLRKINADRQQQGLPPVGLDYHVSAGDNIRAAEIAHDKAIMDQMKNVLGATPAPWPTPEATPEKVNDKPEEASGVTGAASDAEIGRATDLFNTYVTSLDHVVAHAGRGASDNEVKDAMAEEQWLGENEAHIRKFLHWLNMNGKLLNPHVEEKSTESSPTGTPFILNNERATAAFNFLQDRLRKPHVKNVSYDSETDSYMWIGPKSGKKMSMPRSQFEAEIWPDYLKANPIEH